MLNDESEILAIDDIGDVQVERENDWQSGGTLRYVEIVAAPQVDSYKFCLVCKARVEPCNPPLGQCSRCMMMQRYDILCGEQMTVNSNNEMLSLFAFRNIVRELADVTPGEIVVTVALLLARPITELTFNSQRIITNCRRE